MYMIGLENFEAWVWFDWPSIAKKIKFYTILDRHEVLCMMEGIGDFENESHPSTHLTTTVEQ